MYSFASVAILIFSFCTAPLCGQFAYCVRSRQVVISTRLCPGSRVCLHRVRGALGLRRAQRGGSGDENSCLLWLVAASAHSGKSVELEPSCESPRGNKSFLTSPLTHHTAAQNQACVSALLVCVNVHICSGSTCVAVSVSVGVCTQLDLSFIPLPGIMVLSYAWGALCCV